MSQYIKIPIIDPDRCKPKKCNHECKRSCPVEHNKKVCIEIEETAKIHEKQCISCGICVKKCPFNAIKLVNVPSEIKNNLCHHYGENLFRLYKFPTPKSGYIIGFLGQNGIGKSTLLNILSNQILMNFGEFQQKMDHDQILNKIKKSELFAYMQNLFGQKLSVCHKQQDIEMILKKSTKIDKTVGNVLHKYIQHPNYPSIISTLELDKILDNQINHLSGGEMQKLVCAINLLKQSDVYIFDEPTNYLDIEFRLKIASLIRDLKSEDKYVFVVDHDLSVLDYICDYVHILYGTPGAYGVIATQYSTHDAINIYFDGYIPSDNMRFREKSYKLNDMVEIDETYKTNNAYEIISYPDHVIEYDNFRLQINGDHIYNTDHIVMLLGKNGAGKTTFLNYLKNDFELNISYKKQFIGIESDQTVYDYLYNNIRYSLEQPSFVSDVIKTLNVDQLYHKEIRKLSGGEQQKVMITICLGTSADIYLIDEPSASLDIEQRINVIRLLKRFFLHHKKIGIIVEHDILMSVSIATQIRSKILLFNDVSPAALAQVNSDAKRVSECSKLLDFNIGINQFLKNLNVTFRTDPLTRRPKINKPGSLKDNEQKLANNYYA